MENEMSNSKRFLTIYNEIDEFMRKDLKEEDYVGHTDLIIKMIKKGNFVFKYYFDDLKKYAKLRNAIVHNPDQRIADPIAEPHKNIVDNYQDILNKALSPALAIEKIAILENKIFTVSLNSSAFKAMSIMIENNYSHAPVIENNKLIGVFSVSTVFAYIEKKRNITIDEKTKISEFIEYIPIKNHTNESFVFSPKNITVVEVQEIFRKQFINNNRIVAIFITENGRENEKILGLITPWNITGNDIDKLI